MTKDEARRIMDSILVFIDEHGNDHERVFNDIFTKLVRIMEE